MFRLREENRNLAKFGFIPVILSLIGMFLILFSTSRFGVGLSADSAQYIAAAKGLLSGKGYLHYDGSSLVGYPPLFSTVLALFGISGFNLLGVARYVNAITFGLILLVSNLWLIKHVKYFPFVWFGSLAILLSIPLMQASVHAWSEPLFVLFTLISIFAIERHLRSAEFRSLFISAIFASLACLTRYIGMTITITVLLLLLFKRNTAFKRKLIEAVIFGFISLSPMIAWFVIAERRFFSSSSSIFAQNLYFVFDTVSLWFLPSALPSIPRILAVTSIFLLMMAILLMIWRRNKEYGLKIYLSEIAPLVCFLFIYIAFLIFVATWLAIERIGDRFLSPIYAPLILLIIFAIDNIKQFYNRYSLKKIFDTLLILLFSLWLFYPLLRVAKNITYCLKFGSGEYSSVLWKNSELIRYLTRDPLEGNIYSNAPDAIYIFAGINAKMSPAKYSYNYSTPTQDIANLNKFLATNDKTYIVWFENKHRGYLYSIEELVSIFDIKIIAEVYDGTIYLAKLKR